MTIYQKELNKFINIIASHPKLVTFGIGLVITLVIVTIGIIDDHLANATSNVDNGANGIDNGVGNSISNGANGGKAGNGD